MASDTTATALDKSDAAIRAEDDDESRQRFEEVRKAADLKRDLRKANLEAKKLDEGTLKSLDSSIKKNTAVIKKLRQQLNEESREALLEELKGVNLSKYVSEAVASVCEAKLKASDVPAAVQVCSLLHQRYSEFTTLLVPSLVKCSTGKGEDADSAAAGKTAKKRSAFRLLVELFLCGVFTNSGTIVSVVKDVATVDEQNQKSGADRDGLLASLALIISFARSARVLLGLKLPDSEEEVYSDLVISQAERRQMGKAVGALYEIAAASLLQDHAALRARDQEISRLMATRGEVPEETAAAYDKTRKAFEQLQRSTVSLAEALDRSPPELPEDEGVTRVSGDPSGSGCSGTATANTQSREPIWDDDETKSFYEDLPDLKLFVPAVLLGESEAPRKEMDEKDPEEDKAREGRTSGEKVEDAEGDEAPISTPVESPKKNTVSTSDRAVRKDKKEGTRALESTPSKAKEGKGGAESAALDNLLQRLPGCVSRTLIDELSVEFCYLNSKGNRRKLARAVFGVPRTALQLLPYYSRMVATLSKHMPDVGTLVVQMLEEEFAQLRSKKDQLNIESKIKNIRFLGELAKFKVAQAGTIFNCLKACLEDFSHHNIDVMCALLETCGRFLARSPDTEVRMSNMLDIVLRLKNAKSLDASYTTMLDNAYFMCRPPDRPARKVKERPPIQLYIRKLLFSDLSQESLEKVLRQMRKLPWAECEPYIVKCVLKVHRVRYGRIHLLAALTAGLSRVRNTFSVALVDQLMEDIRVGLEKNEFGQQQKRLAAMRLLGELYSYKVVNSALIFETCYFVILFGYATPQQFVLDPPDDGFRIRLIIALLSTCGHFFDRGASKRKLDRFLLYFQNYFLNKSSLPLDVEFDIQDLFAELRPKMKLITDREEATSLLAQLLAKEEKEAAKHAGSGDPATGLLQSIEEEGTGEEEVGLEERALRESDGEGGDSRKRNGGDNDGESEAEDQGRGLDDEESVKVKGRVVPVIDKEEEEAFEKEFKALMQESLAERKLEKRVNTVDMAIPMSLIEGSKNKAADPETIEGEAEGDGALVFKMLLKKGTKQQAKALAIPKESALAQSTLRKEDKDEKERLQIKRRVLEYNDRVGDEDKGLPPLLSNTQSPLAAARGSFSGKGPALTMNDVTSLEQGPRTVRPALQGSWGKKR